LASLKSANHPLGNLRLCGSGFSFAVHQATSVSHGRRNRVRKTASLPTRRQQLSVATNEDGSIDKAVDV